jgi:hypothetical protein
MRRFLFLLAALALAVGGFAAITALAGPPSTVPGSPGDNCSHGASSEPCRPDPSTNGKDCEDHGSARGNEDHCGPGTTTAPPPPPTTTTGHTTTTTDTGHTTTTVPTTTTDTGHTTTTQPGH